MTYKKFELIQSETKMYTNFNDYEFKIRVALASHEFIKVRVRDQQFFNGEPPYVTHVEIIWYFRLISEF